MYYIFPIEACVGVCELSLYMNLYVLYVWVCMMEIMMFQIGQEVGKMIKNRKK